MAENKNYPERPRENIENIISAVAEKENVVTPFNKAEKKHEKKPTPHAKTFGVKYLFWNFLGGLFFGLGLLIMVLLTAKLLINFPEVRSVSGLFGKFAVLLRSLGR